MMPSQILKSVEFTKKQKSRYLQDEILLCLQIENSLIAHQGLWRIKLIAKNSFVAEVTFNVFINCFSTSAKIVDKQEHGKQDEENLNVLGYVSDNKVHTSSDKENVMG